MNSKFLGFAILFSLAYLKVSAQNCDCLSQFLFIKNYIESNNPAYQKIKRDSFEYKNYSKAVKKLEASIKAEKSTDRCIIYLKNFFSLLKDHHSGIDLNIRRIPIDLTSKSSIDSFKQTKNYRAFEKLKIDTASIVSKLRAKSINDIEGIYTNGGSLYFGILKTKRNNYKGIILRKTNLLDIGHVILDIKKQDHATFEFVFHTGLLALNFQNIYQTVHLVDGKIPELGFSKVGIERKQNVQPYEFRALDSSTNYLKISSFDMRLKEELGLFYQSIDSSIQNKPYLIIDLRDNGGGSEQCYFELLKYAYTKPLTVDLAYVWVSPDNIKKYENDGHSKELIDRMKSAAPFTFIPQIQGGITSWESVGTSYPKRVALIFNKKTASSAEGMILYYMQSEKVITLGENSGGYLGYGDVKSEGVPCGKYIINSTTTKYLERSKYEFIGINPYVYLSDKQDWIEAAKGELKKE